MNKDLQVFGGVKSSRGKCFRLFKTFVAFTLAETLIVMGVIGIVSALTLPNLNSSTGDKEKVAKVKKIYQNLQDAFGRAEAVYGPYEEWFVNDGDDSVKRAKRAGERITEFMKVSKDCKQVANQGCFTSGAAKIISGNNYGEFDSGTVNYRIITADGTSLLFKGSDIVVDIDGPNKGSFTWGKDLFAFDINADKGIVPMGDSLSFAEILTNTNPKSNNPKGDAASAWIIRYDNADYLKLTDNTGKCPNGTTISEANPRCK